MCPLGWGHVMAWQHHVGCGLWVVGCDFVHLLVCCYLFAVEVLVVLRTSVCGYCFVLGVCSYCYWSRMVALPTHFVINLFHSY